MAQLMVGGTPRTTPSCCSRPASVTLPRSAPRPRSAPGLGSMN